MSEKTVVIAKPSGVTTTTVISWAEYEKLLKDRERLEWSLKWFYLDREQVDQLMGFK